MYKTAVDRPAQRESLVMVIVVSTRTNYVFYALLYDWDLSSAKESS